MRGLLSATKVEKLSCGWVQLSIFYCLFSAKNLKSHLTNIHATK
ncbi:hypothetical protein HMPREF1584_01020 [Gardnerella vaginalis JCP8481A]|nr:hypothetical protein HMPREF1584_01020 [Gardnerella vaginalis JCP8481A]